MSKQKQKTGWDLLLEKFGNNPCKYQLRAQEYDRCPSTPTYTRRFTAPNDYVAILCMCLHHKPTLDEIEWEFESVEDLIEEYPTYEDLKDYMESCYWGDGDDFILSVINLTENRVLYDSGYDGIEDED